MTIAALPWQRPSGWDGRWGAGATIAASTQLKARPSPRVGDGDYADAHASEESPPSADHVTGARRPAPFQSRGSRRADKQGARRERRPRRDAFAETPWLRFDETAPSHGEDAFAETPALAGAGARRGTRGLCVVSRRARTSPPTSSLHGEHGSRGGQVAPAAGASPTRRAACRACARGRARWVHHGGPRRARDPLEGGRAGQIQNSPSQQRRR